MPRELFFCVLLILFSEFSCFHFRMLEIFDAGGFKFLAGFFFAVSGVLW